MPAPRDHIRGLVHNMRAQVAQASARAQAVRARGDTSIAEFHTAVQQTEAYLDEVDAAAAEMRGVLQDEGANGGPALDDLGNSPVSSLPAGQQAIASAYVNALGLSTLDNALTPTAPLRIPFPPAPAFDGAERAVARFAADGGAAPPRIPRGS